MKKYSGIFLVLLLILSTEGQAQKTRFDGHYPLAAPREKEAELKVEFEKTVTAMLGGVQIMAMETTPSNREDPEAFIKDDYKKAIDEMGVYAIELCERLGSEDASEIKKIQKSIKSNKYSSAISSLENIGAQSGETAEVLYFVWNEYFGDKKDNAPWTDPQNIRITRVYRAMLNYVSKTYERPFGVQAEAGAIVADAAQALSNCLENPTDLAWKGGSKMNMNQEDELKRLASNVAYYNWRMHDRISGKRAAHIKGEVVRHVQLALFDVIRSIVQNQEKWDADPAHGKNLLQLFEDTKTSGWSVNGDKAQKKEG